MENNQKVFEELKKKYSKTDLAEGFYAPKEIEKEIKEDKKERRKEKKIVKNVAYPSR